MTKTSPRQTVTDAMDALRKPIPGLDKMMRSSHRRGGFFIGGGCLTWLVLGVFVMLFVFAEATAIIFYAFAVVALRLLVVLCCLVWWGCASGGSVIQRWVAAR